MGKTIRIGGWVKTGREAGAGAFAFLEVNDGSCFQNIQVGAVHVRLGIQPSWLHASAAFVDLLEGPGNACWLASIPLLAQTAAAAIASCSADCRCQLLSSTGFTACGGTGRSTAGPKV